MISAFKLITCVVFANDFTAIERRVWSLNFKRIHISEVTVLVPFLVLRDQRHPRRSHTSRCVQRLPGRNPGYVTAACLLVVVVKS